MVKRKRYVPAEVLPPPASTRADVALFGWQRVPSVVSAEGECGPGVLTFAGQAMGGDSRKTLSAHVTESGSCMGAGVPVMHP